MVLRQVNKAYKKMEEIISIIKTRDNKKLFLKKFQTVNKMS